jgi:hypothetical protein
MRYRSNTKPRDMTAKFPGKCACCGAPIAAGEWITYYPKERWIGHVGGLEGTSARCTVEIRKSRQDAAICGQ